MSSAPWFMKYRPARFTELYFSDETHFKALEWLRSFKKGSILHITGGCGTGKTSLVYSVAKALKYNVVEYSEPKIENISQFNFSRTLNNTQNLLLIDEGDAPNTNLLHRLAELDLPVIVTSTSLFLKDFAALKIARPSSDLILNAVKSILHKEGLSLDNRVVLRLSEMCNHDFRAVINYCQLLSSSPEVKDLKIVERLSSINIFTTCRGILGKRIGLSELESLYSPRASSLCLNSVMESGTDANGLKCFESLSDISAFPEKYQFLVLDSLNKIRSKFVYRREEPVEISNRHGHKDPAHFLPLYTRNLQNKACILHLQKIFEVYRIETLSDLDREIKGFVDFTTIEQKVFKYRFNLGASSAVKRDTTIREIMDI